MTDRAHARHTDPGTSHAAAASVKALTEKQRAVLDLFRRYGPMIDETLIARYSALRQLAEGAPPEQSESGIRTRRSELVTRGDLMDTGIKARMTTGRMAIVWGLTLQAEVEEKQRILSADMSLGFPPRVETTTAPPLEAEWPAEQDHLFDPPPAKPTRGHYPD